VRTTNYVAPFVAVFAVFCCLFPLRSKYPPQHPIFKHLQSTLFSSFERPCFNPHVCTHVGVCKIPHDKCTTI